MDDESFEWLVGQWPAIRDATSPAAGFMGWPPRGDRLALSLLAGRREYWEALVGLSGFAAETGLDADAVVDELRRWREPFVQQLGQYLERPFIGNPQALLASARMSLSFMPPSNYAEVVRRVGNVEVCREHCLGSSDPQCLSKCLFGRFGLAAAAPE